MNNKDSTTPTHPYSRQLAALLCDQHFGSRPTATLDGQAVLRFTPIRQVNLFVVQQLLAQWTQEMARLRSPYFDFEAEDVRAALTQFMNVLSRRIKLSRQAFEPLLVRAITDTLTAGQDLVATLDEKLLNHQPSVTAAQLRDALRYLDVNKPLYQGFVDTLPVEATLERQELLNQFQRYQEANKELRQPLAAVLADFNALLPLQEEELLGSTPAPANDLAVPAAKLPAPAAPPEVIIEKRAPEPVAAPPAAPVMEEKPASSPQEKPLSVLANAEEKPTAVPLYEKLKASQPGGQPLSETLRPERSTATLAEQAPRVETLREAISINQRFSFINELFAGENMEYHAVIQHLDTLPDAESARRYVSQQLAGKYDWSRKDEHVNKLLKLIDRKFA